MVFRMKKGFTLVELLVVVAILGILAAVGIVSFGGFLGSAKENAARTNHANAVKFIQTSILKCYLGDELILKHNNTTDTPDLCPTVRGEVFRKDFSGNTEDMIYRFIYHLSLSLSPWCSTYGKMHSTRCEEGVEGGGIPGESGNLGVVKLTTDGTKIVIDTRVLENEWVTDRVDLNQ